MTHCSSVPAHSAATAAGSTVFEVAASELQFLNASALVPAASCRGMLAHSSCTDACRPATVLETGRSWWCKPLHPASRHGLAASILPAC